MSSWVYWEQFTWGFPTWQPWNDVIKVTQVEYTSPGAIEFSLTTSNHIRWYKGIQIADSPVEWGSAWTKDDNHGPVTIHLDYIPVFLDNAALEFVRPGWLGVATGVYKVGDLKRYLGKRVTLQWQWDWGANELDGNTRPNPSPPVPGA